MERNLNSSSTLIMVMAMKEGQVSSQVELPWSLTSSFSISSKDLRKNRLQNLKNKLSLLNLRNHKLSLKLKIRSQFRNQRNLRRLMSRLSSQLKLSDMFLPKIEELPNLSNLRENKVCDLKRVTLLL